MEIYVTSQAIEGAYALLLGFAAGLLYDVLSVFRRSVRAKVRGMIVAAVLDTIYCVTCAAAFFMLGFGPGGGRLRFALLLFVAPGIAVYMIFFSRIVTRLLYSLLKIIRRIIQWCLLPFKLLNSARKRAASAMRRRMRYVNKKREIDRSYVTRLRKNRRAVDVKR